ncbi:hypothetical protein [Streptomyces sp. ODS28]|uniref:hypothetical protein n=1 Tax=Streptomyces sp. ODS28 TaxID=3136688 RepID=UPI0031EAE3C4
MTPEQLKDATEKADKAAGKPKEGAPGPVQEADDYARVGTYDYYTAQQMVDHYKDGKTITNYDDKGKTSSAPGYKDFNVGKDGMFWRGVPNKGHDKGHMFDCWRTMFWQDGKDVPQVEKTVSPEVMAGYSYDKIKVPDTEVEMDPKGRKAVNLPTWMWLDKAKFKPVKVRATLPGTGLWAETTARPVALRLDPGTQDAEVHPSSGECRINKDGSIGKPRPKGHEGEPPCGVTYQRATQDGQKYPLKANVTWKISWEGSDGTGGKLPDGEFGSTQDVTVREYQSVVK